MGAYVPGYYELRAEKMMRALEWMTTKYEELVRAEFEGSVHMGTMMAPAGIARYFLEHVDEATMRSEEEEVDDATRHPDPR
ncbi:hypothetical protein LCGC14_2811020 [marine sediment metagenome]|uniref:Uncharacterized protein n=1 Tax=marine sediment metagenome TaxID=412755 RepID=A0A0F9ATA1_9ZZZZ